MSQIASIDDQRAALQAECFEAETKLSSLQSQIAEVVRHLAELKTRAIELEQCQSTEERSHLSGVIKRDDTSREPSKSTGPDEAKARTINAFPFTSEEYRRYGRQLIIPQIGGLGQTALRSSRVLIVGVGGLGCPAAAYLAGAGVGTIGLVDGDTVEISNLHRQIAHSTRTVGMSKVASAHQYLYSLNPLVKYEQYPEHLSSGQAVQMFERYDIVLDCTDHPTSRYLISDACVLAGRPLVSASALKTEGQLIVLNNPAKPAGVLSGGPCYRCIFPKPPPAETIITCGEGGILGPVVGVMGVLQALETIKILSTKISPAENIQGEIVQTSRTSMLLFSAYADNQFRTIKMRSRRPDCAACSKQHTVSRDSLLTGSLDYVAFCGARSSPEGLAAAQRTTASALATDGFMPNSKIIDVRDKTQFGLCSLQGSINIPWTGDVTSWQMDVENIRITPSDQLFLICKLGNDSQAAAIALTKVHPEAIDRIKDISGGFQAWRNDVDPSWPDY